MIEPRHRLEAYATSNRLTALDPLHFCIAVLPLAVYLLLIGLLNLRRTPFVTSGARDAAALCIGISGMVVAGPMELFMPQAAASQYGSLVWLMMIAFYGLLVSLAVLLMRARIVVYNITPEQLRPLLTRIAMDMDSASRWSGDSLLIPSRRIHLHMESARVSRNTQLVSSGSEQSFEGWRELERRVKELAKDVKSSGNFISIPLLAISALLAIGTLAWMLMDKEAVLSAFRQMSEF